MVGFRNGADPHPPIIICNQIQLASIRQFDPMDVTRIFYAKFSIYQSCIASEISLAISEAYAGIQAIISCGLNFSRQMIAGIDEVKMSISIDVAYIKCLDWSSLTCGWQVA